jgi:type VI secretion system protein VasD
MVSSSFTLPVLATFAVVAAGCTPAVAPVQPVQDCKPPDVALTLIASKNINRDDDGQARPVQVRMYQLKTDTRILNATFEELWKDDKTTLGEDLVKVDEFPMFPDTRSDTRFKADNSARFLVAVALFRTPRGRSWFTEYEMPVSTKGHCAPSPLEFAVYIDQTRIDEGSDHIDEYPDKARIRPLQLKFDPPSNPPAKGGDDTFGQGRP